MRLHFAKKYSLCEANKMRGEEYFVTLLDSVRHSGQNFSITFQIVFATLHQTMQSVGSAKCYIQNRIGSYIIIP